MLLDAGIGDGIGRRAWPWSSAATASWSPRRSTGPQIPAAMARAMALAVEAGLLSRQAGRIPARSHAEASSPFLGIAEL